MGAVEKLKQLEKRLDIGRMAIVLMTDGTERQMPIPELKKELDGGQIVRIEMPMSTEARETFYKGFKEKRAVEIERALDAIRLECEFGGKMTVKEMLDVVGMDENANYSVWKAAFGDLVDEYARNQTEMALAGDL